MVEKTKVASFDEVAARFEQAVDVFARDAAGVVREIDASLKRAKKKSERLEYLFNLSKKGRTNELEAELFGRSKVQDAKPQRSKAEP